MEGPQEPSPGVPQRESTVLVLFLRESTKHLVCLGTPTNARFQPPPGLGEPLPLRCRRWPTSAAGWPGGRKRGGWRLVSRKATFVGPEDTHSFVIIITITISLIISIREAESEADAIMLQLDCYWVGSLDFNFTKPPTSETFCRGVNSNQVLGLKKLLCFLYVLSESAKYTQQKPCPRTAGCRNPCQHPLGVL